MSLPDHPSPASLPGPAFEVAPRVQRSRCFRTGPDGRIAITNDWRQLLREVRSAGLMALQTRHPSARLVAVTAMHEWERCSERRAFRDETGELSFNFDHWHRAWGLLRACDCCSSPGRIEVCDAGGREFLQFCAMPGFDSLAWANLLASLVADGPPAFSAPAACDSHTAFSPLLPRSAVRLPPDIDEFTTLLVAFGDARIPVTFTLSTPGALHRREFVPRQTTVDDGILSAGEKGDYLQLALPAVRSLALTSSSRGWALHLVGADDALLLTLSAATGSMASTAWHEAMQAAFPAR